MAIICISLLIFNIILAIAFEISPETPVSISSKIIVGNFECFDKTYLTDNKILDNSPPEAILNRGAWVIPLLAENITSISSNPNLLKLEDLLITKLNDEFFIPKFASRDSKSDFRIGIIFFLEFEIFLDNS